jgi:hypothetical protein
MIETEAVIGGLGGFIVGGIYALANDQNPVAGAAIGMAGGALLGGLFGSIDHLGGVGAQTGAEAGERAAPAALAYASVTVQGAAVASHLAVAASIGSTYRAAPGTSLGAPTCRCATGSTDPQSPASTTTRSAPTTGTATTKGE